MSGWYDNKNNNNHHNTCTICAHGKCVPYSIAPPRRFFIPTRTSYRYIDYVPIVSAGVSFLHMWPYNNAWWVYTYAVRRPAITKEISAHQKATYVPRTEDARLVRRRTTWSHLRATRFTIYSNLFGVHRTTNKTIHTIYDGEIAPLCAIRVLIFAFYSMLTICSIQHQVAKSNFVFFL